MSQSYQKQNGPDEGQEKQLTGFDPMVACVTFLHQSHCTQTNVRTEPLKEQLDILGNTLSCRQLDKKIDTTLICLLDMKLQPGDAQISVKTVETARVAVQKV